MNELFIKWGNFFFHTRNVLFPVLMLVIVVLCPPVASADRLGTVLLFIGLIAIVLGQTLRVLTIGLAYIIRGGRNRRVYAEKLVTEGVFAHCRNPLYVGNILIVIGFLFVSGNVLGLVIGSALFISIYRLIVYSEEAFLGEKFGQDYQNFVATVPRWLPNLQGLSATVKQYEFDWPAVAVKEYGTLFTSVMIPLSLITWKLHLANNLSQYQTVLVIVALCTVLAYGVVRFLKKTERLRSMR